MRLGSFRLILILRGKQGSKIRAGMLVVTGVGIGERQLIRAIEVGGLQSRKTRSGYGSSSCALRCSTSNLPSW